MNVREVLEKANKQLMAKIDDAMTKEVFEEVRDEEAATIYSEVYKVYTPRMYRRRGEYGGLGDPYNIEIRGGAAKGGVMVVVNMTEPNPGGCMNDDQVTTGKNLPELVEFGDGYKFYHYDFPSRRRYMEPQRKPRSCKCFESWTETTGDQCEMKFNRKRW